MQYNIIIVNVLIIVENLGKQVIKDFVEIRKTETVVVNEVCKQVWNSLQNPIMVNRPYISSYKAGLLGYLLQLHM